MLYSFSLFSILEVLLVIVPALLSVAYVTVAERKTMASMQRRVGPNKVGYLGLLQAFETQLVKRSFHTGVSRHNSINLNNEHLKELYRDRIAPVKAFNKDL
jgi:NADH:ubiquinone oxidoreductase subunit H